MGLGPGARRPVSGIASLTKHASSVQLLLPTSRLKKQDSMSHPFTPMARRLLCQSPAAFFRHCRSNACQSSVRCSSAVAAPQRTYHSARQFPRLQRLEKSSFPYLFVISRPNGWARPFTTATPTCATTVLQNPRLDEHGNEMTIEISDRAAKVRTWDFRSLFSLSKRMEMYLYR